MAPDGRLIITEESDSEGEEGKRRGKRKGKPMTVDSGEHFVQLVGVSNNCVYTEQELSNWNKNLEKMQTLNKKIDPKVHYILLLFIEISIFIF